jgi:hypothetical protein
MRRDFFANLLSIVEVGFYLPSDASLPEMPRTRRKHIMFEDGNSTGEPLEDCKVLLDRSGGYDEYIV